MGPAIRSGVAALALLAAAGCETAETVSRVPVPPERPDRPAAAVAAPPVTRGPARSAAIRALERYYARVERTLVAQGLLRTDGGGPDTPINRRMLVENFVRIALFDEYVDRGGVLVAEQRESRLRRWDVPVDMSLTFGDTVEEEKRRSDRAALARYARRLARVTEHPVTLGGGRENFHVLILNEDERRAYGPKLRDLVPGIGDTAVRTITDMPRETFCLVFAFSRGESASYTRAVAVIRGEHPDLLRLSCIQEEVAQGLGLANDSPRARPSIFNDDEEFGLLTTHDELLLRILYDDRLETGMRADRARPIVEEIAAELLGGEG
jgi:hypothetical protein